MVSRVATSIKCVVNLTVQYFIVYTALALIQTVDDVWPPFEYEKVPVQTVLQTAALTVNYASLLASASWRSVCEKLG